MHHSPPLPSSPLPSPPLPSPPQFLGLPVAVVQQLYVNVELTCPAPNSRNPAPLCERSYYSISRIASTQLLASMRDTLRWEGTHRHTHTHTERKAVFFGKNTIYNVYCCILVTVHVYTCSFVHVECIHCTPSAVCVRASFTQPPSTSPRPSPARPSPQATPPSPQASLACCLPSSTPYKTHGVCVECMYMCMCSL